MDIFSHAYLGLYSNLLSVLRIIIIVFSIKHSGLSGIQILGGARIL